MISIMNHVETLISILHRNPEQMRILVLVNSLHLPGCWVGGGLIRNTVWDALGLCGSAPRPSGDVDVLWFDPVHSSSAIDQELDQQLGSLDPSVQWSVKNQSRMHTRNGDAPYQSTMDAMKYWPETATATAARCNAAGDIEILAPFGLDDLFQGVIRPTPRFMTEKRAIFDQRCREKGWLEHWPFLRVVLA